MDANRHGYEGTHLEVIVREARRHLEELPGVRSTALVSPAPFSGARAATGSRRGDAPDSPAVSTFLAAVSPDFHDVIDLQIVRGRWFSGTADEEVVINCIARQPVVGGGDPLGQRLTTGEFNRNSHVVVGVVRDAVYAELRHQHEPFLFRPGRTGTIMVRTSGPAAALARSATAAVKQLDARLVVRAALPAERVAQDRTAGHRKSSRLRGSEPSHC